MICKADTKPCHSFKISQKDLQPTDVTASLAIIVASTSSLETRSVNKGNADGVNENRITVVRNP
jgi:hypothetical protein